MNPNDKNPQKSPKYSYCDCNYNTCNKKDLTKHLHTIKHISVTNPKNPNEKIPKNPITIKYVFECGKIYKLFFGIFCLRIILRKMTNKKCQKMPKIMNVTKCAFICSKKHNFETHLLIAKHKIRTNTNKKMPKNAENIYYIFSK